MVTRLALAVSVAIVVFATTAVVYHRDRGDREVVVDFERGYEGGLVSGFNNRERLDGSYFRWTKAVSTLDFHHFPSTGDVEVEARLRVRRPSGEPLPNLAFTANGVTVHRSAGLPGTVAYHFTVPEPGSRLLLGIRSDTFDPSGKRPLGVQVLGLTLRFAGHASWLEPAAWMGTVSVLLFVAALAVGAGPWWASSSSLVSSLAFVYLLAQHAVRFTPYPREVAALALATLVVAWLLERLRSDPRPWVNGTLVFLFLVEMAVVFYPLRVSSDAQFQANRMEHFLDGDWHPTSVTQHEPAFEIPYPPSLYAVTTPLVMLGADRVTALSFTTGLFDVVVSFVLMLLAWRFLDDVRAGAIAAVLYQFVPLNNLSFSAGNFTNLFAVSMLTLAFWALFRSPVACGLFTALALTAHFGMLLEGVVLFPLWLASLWLGPAPAVRDDRKRLTVAIVLSFAFAGVYYLGYWDLFSSQWERALWGGSGSVARSGIGLPAGLEQLGWVFLAVAVLGAVVLFRRPLKSAFHTASAVWLGVTCLFFLVDASSSLEIRYVLQALPLLALLAGAYLSGAFERGRVGKTSASAAILYIVVTGARTIHDVLLIRYH